MAHRLQSDSIVKHPEMQPTQILPRAERQKNLMALTKREELSSFGRQATPAPSRSRHCDEEGESPEIRATKRISQNNNATMCRHSSGPKQQTRRQLGIPEATSKERLSVLVDGVAVVGCGGVLGMVSAEVGHRQRSES